LRIKFVLTIICFSIIFFGNLIPLNAQTLKQADSVISISPAEFKFDIKPGEKQDFKSVIHNNTNEDLNIKLEFKSLDLEQYLKSQQLFLSTDKDNPGIWLYTKTTNINLKKQSNQEVNFTIDIPSNADIQGYYPVIVYNIENTSANNPINIAGAIVSRIYLNVTTGQQEVKGTSIEPNFALAIKSFFTKNKFVFTPSANFQLNYTNTSNTFFTPRGVIKIIDRTGKQLTSFPTINDNLDTLVQGQDKTEYVNWSALETFKFIPDFGEYKAVVELYPNFNQKNIITSETTFIVIPIVQILIYIAILTGLIILARRKVKSLRLDNKSN